MGTLGTAEQITPQVLTKRHVYVGSAIVLLVYLALTVLASRTKIPWTDEGEIASAGHNLVANGFMGVTVYGPWIPGNPERHMYYVMPFGVVLQSAVYKIFGFSLMSMRLWSAFCGLVAIGSWFSIVKRLSGRESVAAIAAFILAMDYIFLMGSSFGRFDVMCMAFGSAGLALYLKLRTSHLEWGLFAAHFCVAASGLIHPLGILYLFGLIFLMLYFDRNRLFSWKVLLAVALPYAIGGAAWGAYILQSPQDFLAQFKSGMQVGDRMSTWHAPWKALGAEIFERYARTFGLREHSAGSIGPIAMKAVVLLAYITGVAGCLAIRRIRKSPAFVPLIGLTATFFVTMMLVEGQRLSFYLVHIIPLYAALLALLTYWALETRRVPRWLVFGLLAAMLVPQIGGAALRIRQNRYAKEYLPAVQFLREHAHPGELIVGGSHLSFALGFDLRLLDDHVLGRIIHQQPDWIVVDEHYQEAFDRYRTARPVDYAYVQEVLSHCRKVYDSGGFTIYQRIQP